MSGHDEISALREEVESLADFLRMVQREHAQLRRDFAAALRAAGGAITVSETDFSGDPTADAIERITDPRTGTTTFRLPG